jgi:hypothetical protein
MGMDYDAHIAYVKFIVERGALPLANDGWQMFQSPLYYLLCAGIAKLAGEWNGLVLRLFRLISVASALAQIEIAYRIARRVFAERAGPPEGRDRGQRLLPMGFWVSQGIGNEPLHAALAAGRSGSRSAPPTSRDRSGLRDAALLGAVWGLALLAKVSALLLAAPLAGSSGVRIAREPARWSRELASAVLAGVASLAVAGWYYARNWALSERRSWTHSLALDDGTWQEPGYRTLGQLTGFGPRLVRPFLSAMHGFWDGYYSTLGRRESRLDRRVPRHPALELRADARISLGSRCVPSALIVAGFVHALARRRGEADRAGLADRSVALATQIAAVLVVSRRCRSTAR